MQAVVNENYINIAVRKGTTTGSEESSIHCKPKPPSSSHDRRSRPKNVSRKKLPNPNENAAEEAEQSFKITQRIIVIFLQLQITQLGGFYYIGYEQSISSHTILH